MRQLWLLLLFVPLAAAQTLSDPEGDHQAGFAPQDSGGEPLQWIDAAPLGWHPYADVLEAGIVGETDTHLVFALRLASWAPGSEPETHAAMRVGMPFTFHGEPMEAAFEYRIDRREGRLLVGTVQEFSFAQTTMRHLRPIHVVAAEMVDGVLVASYPKEMLLDSQLVPARAGDIMAGFTVEAEATSYWRSSPCFEATRCWRARDPVEGSFDYTIQHNAPGVGHLLLDTATPYRGSNGEATTFLFNLTLRNIGDIDDRVTIQVGGQPADWVVHAPATLVLPRGGRADIPIAVSVPFKHVHGERETLEVRVASTSMPGIEATREIGVVWHEVPQPGGHHPMLYLHSMGRYGWMNTLRQDAQAEPGAAIQRSYSSTSNGPSGASMTRGYSVYLSPGLLVGLDFVPGETVSAVLPFEAPEALDGTLRVALVLAGQDERVLAQASQPVGFDAGRNVIEIDLPLQDGVDRIPFAKEQNLMLDVELAWQAPRQPVGLAEEGEPVISTDGASLEMPLQDYHDIIDGELLASLARLSLRADGEVSRLVNPGRTAAIPFTATNAGSRATVDWAIEGSHPEWARVVPMASEIPGKGNATVLVAVTPPADPQDGEAAQLLLIGRLRSDPDVQVFARLAITVTTTADIPDEAAAADALGKQAQESAAKPSPAGLLAVAGLGWAVLRRRVNKD